jgi:hypothetical protein
VADVNLPGVGQIWEDASPIPGGALEWVEVLHTSSTHVLVQRRNGIARYERSMFDGPQPRFRLITTEGTS